MNENTYYEAKRNEKAVAAADAMTRLVNTFGKGNIDQFITLMAVEHRTLQNSFTRLCLAWIEYAASPEYRTDGRNQSGADVCKQMLAAFRKEMEQQGYTGSSLETMSKPSEYCAHI